VEKKKTEGREQGIRFCLEEDAEQRPMFGEKCGVVTEAGIPDKRRL